MLQITPSEATSLGSAGLLAYLVIKEVLAFTGKKRNGNGKKIGEMDPAFLELLVMQIIQKEMSRLNEERKGMIDKLDKILEKQNDTNFVIAKLLMRGVRPSPSDDEGL